MIKAFTSLLLCLLAFGAGAQRVMLKNGRLIAHDSVYCLYETDNYDDYPSYVFSTKNSEQLVFADAFDLSTARELYMVHYYRVSFPLLGEEFYIRYQSNRMQYLAEDLVRYGVFRDDRWNPEAAAELIAAWRKKMDAISPEEVASGTSIFSNPVHKTVPQDSLLAGISFRDNKIYRGNAVIGKYEVSDQPVRGGAFNRGHAYYYFMDLKGNMLAQVIAPERRSIAYMKIGDEDKSMQLLCPDKSAEKLLRVATGVLLMRGLL